MSEVNQSEKTVESSENLKTKSEKSEVDLNPQSGVEKNHDDVPEGVKKRLAKLTKEKYEVKNQYESLKNEFETFKSKFEKPKEFGSEQERIDHLVDERLKKITEQTKNKEVNDQKISKLLEKYNSTTSHVDDLEDFDDVIATAVVDLNDPVDSDINDFCINSDSGKRLAYEIAKNPELLETLRNMSNSVRAKTLIKLDDQLYTGISAKKAEKIVEKTIEEAPESKPTQKKIPKLITPSTGKSTPKGFGPKTMEEYMAERNQRISKNK